MLESAPFPFDTTHTCYQSNEHHINTILYTGKLIYLPKFANNKPEEHQAHMCQSNQPPIQHYKMPEALLKFQFQYILSKNEQMSRNYYKIIHRFICFQIYYIYDNYVVGFSGARCLYGS